MKLDLSKNVTDLDGKEIDPPKNVSKLLAEAMAYTNKGPAVKYVGWAIDLKKHGHVEIDKSDMTDVLKKFAEECETLTNLVKAQIINEINATILRSEQKLKDGKDENAGS